MQDPEQVDDLDGALREVVRVMKPRSHVLLYTTVTTDLLTAQDAAVLGHHLGNVEGNLDRSRLEDAFTKAGPTRLGAPADSAGPCGKTASSR